MRLKRTLNRRVGDKEYFKWLIADIPPDMVQELGWQEGEELEGVPEKDGLLIRSPKPTEGAHPSRRARE